MFPINTHLLNVQKGVANFLWHVFPSKFRYDGASLNLLHKKAAGTVSRYLPVAGSLILLLLLALKLSM